jgi:hypothetical protein
MITKVEAQLLVEKILERDAGYVTGGLSVLPERTITKPYGWVFFYDSNAHIQAGTLETAIAGNGPIVVIAATAEVVPLGTAYPSQTEIARFERARGL